MNPVESKPDAAHLNGAGTLLSGDVLTVCAVLKGQPPMSAVDLAARTALNPGRLRFAVRALTAEGRLIIIRTQGYNVPGHYVLLSPDLPDVDAPTLTPHAAAVLEYISTRPAETEIGLSAALNLPRQEIKHALAHLDALKRVTWGGIGHLILWRAA